MKRIRRRVESFQSGPHMDRLDLEPYDYLQLPAPTSLRHCVIQPSSDSNENPVISISIVPFRTGDNSEGPPYEALSYAWGSEEDPLPVYVVSRSARRRILMVTRNLHSALRHLRRSSEPRTMWIDAIRINQKDNVERNEQVRIMGHIFRNAKRVVVWLGPRSEDSHQALVALKHLASKFEIDKKTWDIQPVSDSGSIDSREVVLSLSEMHAVTAFVQRAWFRRLWIRLEIGVANECATVVCGGVSISWSTLWSALMILYRAGAKAPSSECNREEYGDANTMLLESMRALRGMLQQGRLFTLIDLRARFSSSLCKDPRDRIYAVMSLLDDADLNTVPDYEKPCPEVYQEAILRYFEVRGNLSAIGSCELRPAADSNAEFRRMPSWVPDWSQPMKTRRTVFAYARSHLSFKSSPVKINDEAQESSRILRVAGVTTSLVSVGLNTDVMPHFESMDLAEKLYAAMRPQGRAVELGEDAVPAETYARTLFGGSDNTLFRPPTTTDPLFKDGVHVVNQSLTGTLPSNGLSQEAQGVLRVFCETLYGRRLCWDKRGCPILCPDQASPGDEIAVIPGCNFPMLLRPLTRPAESSPTVTQSTGRERLEEYQVVGACFTGDAAFWGALLGPLPENVRAAMIVNADLWQGFVNSETDDVSFFDPRLDFGADEKDLGFNVETEKERRQLMWGARTEWDFDQLRDLVIRRTGNELRWLDLV